MCLQDLHPGLQQECQSLYRRLPGIQDVVVKNDHFRNLSLPRDRYLYRFVLQVSSLITQNILPMSG